MKILSVKPLEKTLVVECHSMEDFHVISRFIQANDIVSGETDRNIKPKEPGQKPFRLKMFISIKAQSAEADESSATLRVSGLMVGGHPSEFVEINSQHALVFFPGQPITIQKFYWFDHEMTRLREQEKESHSPLYFGVVLDDEHASFVHVSGSGLREAGNVSSFKSGKQFHSEKKEEAYFSKIAEIVFASPLNVIVIAGPGFTREELVTYLKENTPPGKKKQFLSVATADIGLKGARQAFSAEHITNALGQSAQLIHSEKMDEVLKQLGKNSGLVTYGLVLVAHAIKSGAAKEVLVSNAFLHDHREMTNQLLEEAHRSGIPVSVLDEKHEAGKQLDGLGGIVALLHYAMKEH